MPSSLPVRLSPRPVRTLSRRVAASQAADDLQTHWKRLVLCCGVLALALLVGFTSRGYVATWHGFEPVPAPTVIVDEKAPCGSYCGTDAIYRLP